MAFLKPLLGGTCLSDTDVGQFTGRASRRGVALVMLSLQGVLSTGRHRIGERCGGKTSATLQKREYRMDGLGPGYCKFHALQDLMDPWTQDARPAPLHLSRLKKPARMLCNGHAPSN